MKRHFRIENPQFSLFLEGKQFMKQLSILKKLALTNLAIVLSICLGTSNASAVPFDDGLFTVDAFQLSAGQLNNTPETRLIWNGIDGGAGIGDVPIAGHTIGALESDTASQIIYNGNFDGFVGSVGYSTIGGGTVTGGNDFSVRARTFVEFTTGGTYSISSGSDDGREIVLSDIGLSTGYSGFSAAGNQVDGFVAGSEAIEKTGTTGHAHTTGVFSVDAGDVLALDAMFFERGGGDQFHIAIKLGSDTGFGGTGDNWELLTDGALNGFIQLTSDLAPSVPEPATATLALLGLGGLMRRRRRMA